MFQCQTIRGQLIDHLCAAAAVNFKLRPVRVSAQREGGVWPTLCYAMSGWLRMDGWSTVPHRSQRINALAVDECLGRGVIKL